MDDSIRRRLERVETEILSPLAAFSQKTRGRAVDEPESDIRTAYQRDRDRVIHSNAFRRLKHKTQVFLSPEGDHYRTRLTHTLEVAQIARTISRALQLNEDLTEAIALGHDLGHTPFGHAGERALAEISKNGFKHYEQSVRVCEKLEKGGRGLNLTWEVLNGIIHHTHGEKAATLEGQVVRISDKIAYINHDIDDAVRAGVIQSSDIPIDICERFGYKKSERINNMVMSVIYNGLSAIDISKSDEQLFKKLHEFLYERVYLNPIAKSEESKVSGIILALYEHFLKHTALLPEDYRQVLSSEDAERAVVDYIAGMTDRYAIQVFEDIYIPRSWNV